MKKTLALCDKSFKKLDAYCNDYEQIPGLERLDLRLNKDLVVPNWIEKLRDRGCTVYT
jgi:hypothetical protein